MFPALLLTVLLYQNMNELKPSPCYTSYSGAGNDNNHAHPDTSMKLGRNVHWHELLEFSSLANQNRSIFKMAALKSKIAATINVKS